MSNEEGQALAVCITHETGLTYVGMRKLQEAGADINFSELYVGTDCIPEAEGLRSRKLKDHVAYLFNADPNEEVLAVIRELGCRVHYQEKYKERR